MIMASEIGNHEHALCVFECVGNQYRGRRMCSSFYNLRTRSMPSNITIQLLVDLIEITA